MSDGTKCTYCGGIALHWDHVVPEILLRPNSNRKQILDNDWVVAACAECNGALADRMLHTVPLRAEWLLHRYRRKYKKLMLNAVWTDEELEQLNGSLRRLVEETMCAQAELDYRLAHLRMIAGKDCDYKKPRND